MPLLKADMCPNLTKDVCYKLRMNKIRTVVDFLDSDPLIIAGEIGISYKEVMAIHKVFLIQYSSFPRNGSNLFDEFMATTVLINTGCLQLDRLLKGGLFTGEITELVGGPGSGKTQLCISIASQVALSNKQSVLYIDTQAALHSLRVLQLLKIHCTNTETLEEAMGNIRRCTSHSAFDLIELLENLKYELSKQNGGLYGKLRLIIIDSLSSILSPVMWGNQGDGLGLMVYLASLLKELCVKHLLTIVVTNNIVQGDNQQIKPALGRYWHYVPNNRLLLSIIPGDSSSSNGSSLNCNITVVKSARQETNSSIKVSISEGGIVSCELNANLQFSEV